MVQITSPPRPAREVLTDICVAQGWFATNSEAAEHAERWEKAFLAYLRRDLSERTSRNRLCLYDFNSSSLYMVQGSAFVEEGVDDDAVKAAKGLRANYYRYTEALKRITPGQFESMCRGMLRLLGLDDVRLTPYSGDEGLDFYGRFSIESAFKREYVLPGIHRGFSVWMIGQAKHYQQTQVATPDIRDLVGAVALAKVKAFGGSGTKYDDLDMKVCDPVFHLFFTTGTISADSWRLLERSGVLAMDGEMVAAFLADNGVAVDDGIFDEARLTQWLADAATA